MNGNTLAERLDWLLDGRDKHPWGKAMGLGKNQVAGLSSGTPSKWDALNAIRCHENVDPVWLLEGVGRPFRTSRFSNDKSRATWMRTVWLTDERASWSVIIIVSGSSMAFALTAPSSYIVVPKGGESSSFSYTCLELVIGGGRQSLDAIRKHATAGIRLAQVSMEQMETIERGEAGTWRLLHSPDAWLKDAELITAKHAIFKTGADEPAPLADYEQELLAELRLMSPDIRDHYLALARGLAPKKPRP